MQEEIIKLKKLRALEKIQLHKEVTKKFGKEGIEVIKMLEEGGRNKEALVSMGIKEKLLEDILKFLENKGYLEKEEKIEIVPTGEEEPKIVEEEKEKIVPRNYAEQVIYNKFGELGVKVYRLLDQKASAEEIIKELGISEEKLLEIVAFLEEKELVEVERPKKKKKDRERFGAMIGEASELEEVIDKDAPLFVKRKQPLDIFHITLATLKFGKRGMRIFNAIKEDTTDVEIAAELLLPIKEVEKILEKMANKGFVEIRKMNRKEVREWFGDEAFSVYKRNGKNGLLAYELIGKDIRLKQIYDTLSISPEEFYEVLAYIHRVLGLDFPIDRKTLIKEIAG